MTVLVNVQFRQNLKGSKGEVLLNSRTI